MRPFAAGVCLLGLLAATGVLRAAGTGSVDKVSGWYPAGSNLTATATPGAYSVFDGWLGDTNNSTITSNQIGFSVSGPRVVTASFTELPKYTITVAAPFRGTIVPGGPVQVYRGYSTNFVITPDKHYSVSGLTTNGVGVTVPDPAGFTFVWNNVKAAGALEAAFVRRRTTSKSVPTEWLEATVPSSTNDYEAAVAADPDGDGFSTGDEYWTATDPSDGSSYFKLDGFFRSGSNVVLQWAHACVDADVPPIMIRATDHLTTGVWVNIGSRAPADGTHMWTNAAPQSFLFYRLAVTNAP